jgi:hypothetical protein
LIAAVGGPNHVNPILTILGAGLVANGLFLLRRNQTKNNQ